jgi:hypothetical protein
MAGSGFFPMTTENDEPACPAGWPPIFGGNKIVLGCPRPKIRDHILEIARIMPVSKRACGLGSATTKQ